MNFETPSPEVFKVKPEDYEKTGEEFLTANRFENELSTDREGGFRSFERKFGVPGIMYKEFVKQVATGPGYYDCYHLKRLYGEIDGSKIDILFREFAKEDEKTKEVTEGMEIEGGKIGNTNLDELFERLRSDERARWKEKIKAMIETYGKYAKNEKHVVESANMLSDANAVMYKLEKGADFLNKKKEKVN